MSRQWNPETVTRIRLRRKVSVAVQVIDDFTGRPITAADLSVSAQELLEKPLRKGDGYFLFMDCPEKTIQITAHSWTHHAATVTVTVADLPPLRPVVKLRLTPNRSYSIPYQTTCLEGEALPGTQLRIFCENDPHPLRLLYDYSRKGAKEGRLLQIYDPADSDLEGRQFALVRKGETVAECFQVREAVEGEAGGCLLFQPLAQDCKKAGATLLPLFTVQADGAGQFFLPLRTLAVKSYHCRILWAAPKAPWQECTLEMETGRVTKLNLREKK